MEVNGMDYWWKRAKAAEELLGKIKWEIHQDAPQEQKLTIKIVQDMLVDVKVVKPTRQSEA